MLSRYSVSQSSSLAGLIRESSIRTSSVPRSSQPASTSAERMGRGSARSEEHTSELQSLMRISYAVFCLKKKHKTTSPHYHNEQENQTTTTTQTTTKLQE